MATAETIAIEAPKPKRGKLTQRQRILLGASAIVATGGVAFGIASVIEHQPGYTQDDIASNRAAIAADTRCAADAQRLGGKLTIAGANQIQASSTLRDCGFVPDFSSSSQGTILSTEVLLPTTAQTDADIQAHQAAITHEQHEGDQDLTGRLIGDSVFPAGILFALQAATARGTFAWVKHPLI
jgi:hypothetical protein